MESTDGPKEETRRRRRRRSSDSVLEAPMRENIGAHPPTDRGSSAPGRSDSAELTPSEQHHAPLSLEHRPLDTTTRSSAQASPTGSSPRFSAGRHTGKRRASGEMIHREEETTTMQSTIARASTATGDEIRRPDLPERADVSLAAHSSSGREVDTQDTPGTEHHKPTVAVTHAPTLRVSSRRTTTTTRWSPSMTGARDHTPSAGASRTAGTQRARAPPGSSGSTATPPVRPISNATRNINFGMLQPHFERPLQQAADSFGVCTTLLKKICRRNGISNWPYRKICGLRKSIASMAKQVNYFDGEQKRAYADQLEKLEHELHAYLRTGNEPTEEFLRTLSAEAGAPATDHQQQGKPDAHTAETNNDSEEKEALAVPTWTARPSIALPRYNDVQIDHPTHGMQTTPRRLPAATASANAWSDAHSRLRGPPLQAPAFPTIATHHRTLPSIASILQHQSYSSPSRAASTQNPPQCEVDQQQPQQWRYFPPSRDDAV
ncbi:hypothetical protein PHYPSEUDO_002258 [Phytophthora pseudosyringae]|uniref:RWP-RK domain-containing protein n=1 Tax=Phytophthora pseudosyringae TaxID=221518 RepID=A0A8T1VXL1_9STRA|nr:hypothetical protein PHYPSEUDO_002258 [Phytophthora pseudosyringae]